MITSSYGSGLSFRGMLPACVVLVLVLFMGTPAPLFKGANAFPYVSLIAVCYWSTFAPSVLPMWFVFLLGFVQDIMLGMPLGSSSSVLLLMQWVVLKHRRSISVQNFQLIWGRFVVYSLAATVIWWLLLSWVAHGLLPPLSAMLTWAVTVLAYPLFHVLFTKLYRLLPVTLTRV